MINPPITGNDDLDSWLYNLSLEAADGFGGGGGTTITNIYNGTNEEAADPSTGVSVEYPHQYIHIKYADDNIGTGFSNVPTNKLYWGIHNNASLSESTNVADYTWFQTQSGFGSLTSLYYLILGGNQIKFAIATTQPDYKWLVDAGLAVDLHTIVPSATISFTELMDNAVTELKVASSAITATKINVAALDQALGDLRINTVSAAQLVTDSVTGDAIAASAVTAVAIAAGAVTTTKLEAGAVISEKIAAGAVTADKITVNSLSAVSANMGAITAGSLNAVSITGSSITGTTITGNTINGGSINGTTGTFAGDLTAAGGTFLGTLDIASAASGARMEIKNNVIKVYDDFGNLRVQIGDLTV